MIVRILRALWFLYLIIIFGFVTVAWTLWLALFLVKLVEGHHFTATEEGVLWPLIALWFFVVPGCAYATRWLWRRWRRVA
jgi:hypothetical protein